MSRGTQDPTRPLQFSPTGLSPSMVGFSKHIRLTSEVHVVVLQPQLSLAGRLVWAVPRSLAATSGITIVFSSFGY